jgi:thiamine pyrophosphokinase
MGRMDGWRRHIEAVRNVTLPGDYVPFRLGAAQVGWLAPSSADVLVAMGLGHRDGAVVLDDAARLPGLARGLAGAGRFAWRGEAFDVRAVPDGPVLATIDRGALPWFGIAAEGVHVNGLVHRADGLHLWVARRAADRPIDPGKLDHLFAGGIPAGLDRAATLVKEGAEEAGLDAAVVREAVYAGVVAYDMVRPEGLRRDRLHCYDLVLPEAVRPVPCDGEVAGFELWPIGRVVETVRGTDDFKFNVNLVLMDLFVRLNIMKEEVLS